MNRTGTGTPSAWTNLVTEALHHWWDQDSDAGLLAGLTLFRRARQATQDSARTANNHLLKDALLEVRRLHPLATDLLHLRFVDQKSVKETAALLGEGEQSILRQQRQAIRLLAAALLQMEGAAVAARQAHAAPAVYAQPSIEPVGIDNQVAALLEAISNRTPPWIYSLEGMGGLGKTTLAAALLAAAGRENYFEDFAWASAQMVHFDVRGQMTVQQGPALTQGALVATLLAQLAPQEAAGLLGHPEAALGLLRTILKRAPHLVVIDNLETALDIASLLPLLRTLVDPSKIVLTSRQKLVGETDIHLYHVPELSEMDALALLRQAGRQQGVASLSAPGVDLRPIYAVVGGNPLALLLVVGQLHERVDLPMLLANLKGARGAPVENLYTYLYRWAWDHLDERGRRVLLAMSLVKAQGDTLDFVAAVCDLPPAQVSGTLQQLLVLNLVYTLGDMHTRYYAIHSLTRSFLHEQVARWMADD